MKKDCKKLLPTCQVYRELLQKACSHLNIKIDVARKSYGHFTICQWEELLNIEIN